MTGLRVLTADEAVAFAQIVLSGVPVPEAVQYFWTDPLTETELVQYEAAWPRQEAVIAAIDAVAGGAPWHRLTDPQRMGVALTKHYNELAYVLWTTNYAELAGAEKVRADTARTAIEAKLAGMAGRESPLATFYTELLAKVATEAAPVA